MTQMNKAAWEEAFENRRPGWCGDIENRLKTEPLPYIEDELAAELTKYDFTGKAVGQFCCNNGRELLSVMKLGAKEGVGFDIAENMIAWAGDTARRLGSGCRFVAADILAVGEEYRERFDYILVTVGALTWFEDLNRFFGKVSMCLKPGGVLFIHEMHPFTTMLAVPGEANYDERDPSKPVNSYFKADPWLENTGMGYMTGRTYHSKTFCSCAHTFSDIISSMAGNGLCVKTLKESPVDYSECFGSAGNAGIPLSYVLTAEKLG